MSKEQLQAEVEPFSLGQLCLKWLKTPRKARKEADWQVLYNQMLCLLIPQINLTQLLVPSEIVNEQLQLFLNSLIHMQVQQNCCFVEYLTNNILVLLRGSLNVEETNQTLSSPTAIIKIDSLKNEGTQLKAVTCCDLLRGERKILQKLKNDILKQDRQIKENFLSQHLFCGLTPVYPQSAVKLIPAKEGKQASIESDSLMLLQRGLVLRKPKGKGQRSQLTQGSLLNVHTLASIINFTGETVQDGLFTVIQDSFIISFQVEQFLRILKLNLGLKQLLQRKLKLIFDQRNLLRIKSQQIQQEFQDRFRKGAETVRLHYPIEFKARPKTAGMIRSFRKKHETTAESASISEFVTFDRYDKMISSKEQVLVAKSNYRIQVREKSVVPVNYEKRLKQQSKMWKLQTGKIQKMSQRQSRADNSGVRQIKKNLFRVTHLFDQPLDPNLDLSTPIKQKDTETKSSSALRRMSGIKPEDYLKETYLTEFLKKKNSGQNTKDVQGSSPALGNKENQQSFLCYTISQGFGNKKKSQKLNITVSHPA